MRLWTLHPKHLDRRGLVALWREALLAQAVLAGRTIGYRHHPQLTRFRRCEDPRSAISQYLAAVHEEATRRGYAFDRRKVSRARRRLRLTATTGQVAYEWRHLRKKVAARDRAWLRRLSGVAPEPHPLFRVRAGGVAGWEVMPAMGRKTAAESQLLTFTGSVRRDPAVDRWLAARSGELGAIARRWFAVMLGCGRDVRELLHDGHPTACVDDAGFAYVNAFKAHVNVGFFRGAELADPQHLLEGTGRVMRHVKLRPGEDVDADALSALIRSAYVDIKRRLAG
jgi:hypothetical protein